MRSSTILSTLAVAAPVVLAQNTTTSSMMANATMAAGRPANVSICDYYSTALFNSTNGTTEYALLTALVNRAVIGNETTVPKVTGILNNGTLNGTDTQVSLLKYFDGMLASTNNGSDSGVSVNFLDGGGAEPLMNGMPANRTDSNQYVLLTHLYSYFGTLLGCSSYGKSGFPQYMGDNSQYDVHKFMDLSLAEVTYFIQEVANAALSFGVAQTDVEDVGKALNGLFNVRCAPEAKVAPNQDAALQSICITSDCPLANGSVCASYQNSTEPVAGNSSNMATTRPMSAATTMMSGTAGGASATSTAGAAIANAVGAGAVGVAAFAMALAI